MPKISRVAPSTPTASPPIETQEKVLDYLGSYTSHGLDFQKGSGDQVVAECPFCGSEGKFYLNRTNGLFDCKVCTPDGGNLVTFLRQLWAHLYRESYNYSELAEQRGLLSPKTCAKWGIVEGLNGLWLVPGFNHKGEVAQLYRYVTLDNGKHRLYATATPEGEGQGIHRLITTDLRKRVVLCEGIWDALLLSEVIDLTTYDVMAVPGCNIFKASWAPLFADKHVILIFDNDYPKGNGQIPALIGLKRVTSLLSACRQPPESVSYLRWGGGNNSEGGSEGEGYFDSTLPDGYDLSDHLRQTTSLKGRTNLWKGLEKQVVPVPDEWRIDPHKIVLTSDSCTSWSSLVPHWQKAMAWPEPGESLDYALSVMCACCLSTSTQGEPIWLRLIAPPSSGKSVLCEAISVARRYVRPMSIFKGLYSGWAGKDGKNHSLIEEVRGKTVVLKDGNTLQENKDKDVILAELRDAYDGYCRSHFKNGMGRDYEGIRFTLIVGATSESKLDRSGLGERMIDCIALEGMDAVTEEEIGLQVALRTWEENRVAVDGVPESFMTEEMLAAKKKTGGFIEHLREDGLKMINNVKKDIDRIREVRRWAEFVSFMRAQEPLDKGKGHPEKKSDRELSFRLTSQFTRLAACLAAVLGQFELSDWIMWLTRRVCLDTSKGTNLDLAHILYKDPIDGFDVRALCSHLSLESAKIAKQLTFLKSIQAVERFTPLGASNVLRWRLTPRVQTLYKSIYQP